MGKRRAFGRYWDDRARRLQDRAQHAFRNIAAAVERITEVAALRLVARLRALAEKVVEAITPVTSDSEWNAFPPAAGAHKPLSYMALTSEGHMVLSQKRILTVERHLGHDVAPKPSAAQLLAPAVARLP